MIDLSLIVELLEVRAVQQAFRLLVFLGFFAFVAGCLIFIRVYPTWETTIRRVFVVALIIGMIVPTVTGIMFPPFAGWYFFTDPAPESTTQYSVTIVDEDGQEIQYPSKAAPPGGVGQRATQVATNETDVPRDQMAEFLLNRAENRRQTVTKSESDESRLLKNFPPHLGPNNEESTGQIRELDTLHELRIYRTTLNTSSDGLQITSRQSELVYTYHSTDTHETDS